MKKQLKLEKYMIYIACFCTLIISNVFVTSVYGMESEKAVLFISSYNENFITVPEQIKGLKSVFDPEHIHFDIEYMDSKRLDTARHRILFYEVLKNKIDNLEPYDAVIVGDDNALQFAMDYQKLLFDKTPIIFLGINNLDRAKQAAQNRYMTGLVEATSLKENIEIAKKFNKDAKRVVAIVDNTLTGVGDREQFYEIRGDFKDLSFEHINTAYYTFSELGSILQKIEKDTILLYLSMFQDKTGRVISIDEAVEIIKNNTNVPVYRASIGGVGEGLLGGKMVSYFEQGRLAAQIVMDVFGGKPIESIEMIKESSNQYVFDYNIIEKYHIEKRLIPEDAVLINKRLSFYEQNKKVVIIVVSIITLLIAGIVIMMIDNIRRRVVEKALQESHEELTALYEELTASEEELRTQYDEIQVYTEKLESLQQKYKIAIKGTNSAVWEIDLEDKEIYFYQGTSNILDTVIKEKENIHKVLEQFVIPEDKELLLREFAEVADGTKEEIYCQARIKNGEGTLKWLLVNGKSITDANGNLKFMSGIVLDISKIKEQEEYIEHLAYHDALTNLPNRVSFMNKLKEELDGAKSGAVMLLDLDNFKEINDLLGHSYGDMVLKEVTNELNNIADEKMFISRFGGDEFLILIMNEDDPNIIKEYAKKISKRLKHSFIIKNEEIYVYYSMGITRYPYDSNDANQLIMNADTAMYQVKHSGKNNHKFFNKDMIERLREKANIEFILRDAIKNEELMLMYQPQVHVDTGEVVGFEALLRLKKHSIPPNLFIPIAEETGLIIDLGNWVTREAIRQMAEWRDKGFKIKPMAINFSAKQLKDEKYLAFLEKALEEKAIDPKYLEIEITESILLERREETIDFLNKLKCKGVRIALDDFGTGYSSLSYLTFIPVDKIKLDKSLSEKFLEMENIKVMDSIISLAHSLNLQVVAEGIEEVEQYRKLKVGRCDYIQGYIFSRPLKPEAAEEIYNRPFLEDVNVVL
ncbi:MAG: diguanylate cyclase protein [Clostridia bacterium]|jgi:diguanylate cyclase (GGDEF)-like protein/PAS domain S-box-containing protein|nr:diguanylate cyclase protein [Clostridia bacterium]